MTAWIYSLAQSPVHILYCVHWFNLVYTMALAEVGEIPTGLRRVRYTSIFDISSTMLQNHRRDLHRRRSIFEETGVAFGN